MVGAAGGAAFAVLVLIAFAHWQAVLFGFALVFFVWFAGTFAARTSFGPAVLASAAPMAALYLVAIGSWESLGETYGGVEVISVPSESYGDAHALYDVGVGATHLANFMDAAFVGATAAALLAATKPWRRVIVFLTLLAWVLGLSAALVVSIRRGRFAATGTLELPA